MAEGAWRPLVKLQIAREEIFLGPGCRDLLQCIQEQGSVRLGSQKMGLSYSKAWRILNTLESEAGFEVLCRKQGGKSGGETVLTKEGQALLSRFEAYEEECRTAVGEIFQKYFGQEAGKTP